jgi:uncharacterized protein (DUF983 family)
MPEQPSPLFHIDPSPSPDSPERNGESHAQLIRAPHAGDLCPRCQKGYLDYDSLLNLACPACGYTLGGCFT